MLSLVGIMGQAQAGKDTVGAHLIERFHFVRIGLADPLKRFCKDVFDFTDEQLWGNDKEKGDTRYTHLTRNYDLAISSIQRGATPLEYLTPRFALQTLGTEWGRNCYDDIWVDYGIRMAKLVLKGHHYDPKRGITPSVIYGRQPALGVVFTDLRFKNEFNAVKNAGGLLLRVKRPGFEGGVGVAGHASEEEQKEIPDAAFHGVIINDGTLQELYKKVDDTINNHLEL